MGLPTRYFSTVLQSLLTGRFTNTNRIAVDSQQTSFEENAQFRFFDDVSDVTEYIDASLSPVDLSVPANKVLIYEFNAVNAVNIQTRIINQWQGGRKYLVFPKDDSSPPTITDADSAPWEDVSDQLYTINGNKNPLFDALPTTEVTVRRRTADSFVNIYKARTGTAIKTDGNANRSSSGYAPDYNRSGVAENQGFYLVFFDLDGVNPSQFLFTVGYEERFGE